MRPQKVLSFLGSVLSTGVALCILFSTSSEPIYLENVDVQTVVKQVAALTGITFLFDPEQVRGKITVLSPKDVSRREALDLLKSALALHGYTLLSRAEATWIVPAHRVPSDAFTIKVVGLGLCAGWRAGVHPLVDRGALGSGRSLLPHQQPDHLRASGSGRGAGRPHQMSEVGVARGECR
jgi:type II secretory pathway component GspD/PulD (secretin)